MDTMSESDNEDVDIMQSNNKNKRKRNKASVIDKIDKLCDVIQSPVKKKRKRQSNLDNYYKSLSPSKKCENIMRMMNITRSNPSNSATTQTNNNAENKNVRKSMIALGLQGFTKLVEAYNCDHKDDVKNVPQAQLEYETLCKRVYYLSLSKQLAISWMNHKTNKKGIYKPSNDLTNMILSEPELYKGCENASHIFEIVIGGDASEPEVEGAFFTMQLQCHIRHLLHIENYYQEIILKTECKDEHSKETEAILRASAIDWRQNHSSPIVEKSDFDVSPSVDKELSRHKKPGRINIYLPVSLTIPFEDLFLPLRPIHKLRVHDKIDHKMKNGYWCKAKILRCEPNKSLTIKHIGFKGVVKDDIMNTGYIWMRYAKFDTITSRPNHTLMCLKENKLIDVLHNTIWIQVKIIEIDNKSAQFSVDINGNELWYHVDDSESVRKTQIV